MYLLIPDPSRPAWLLSQLARYPNPSLWGFPLKLTLILAEYDEIRPPDSDDENDAHFSRYCSNYFSKLETNAMISGVRRKSEPVSERCILRAELLPKNRRRLRAAERRMLVRKEKKKKSETDNTIRTWKRKITNLNCAPLTKRN